MTSENTLALSLLALVAAALAVSAVGPADRLTWWLEVAPVLIAMPLLVITAQRFPLTNLLYVLIAVHALILIVGGHYTYAKVPLGFWLEDLLDLSRNPYDRIGHLAQGFVPAILAREILLRTSPLERGKWLFFVVCCICLAVSACYEFIEWWAAIIGGGSAEAFLGLQGDVWDTQWDMFLALCGAVAAQLLLARSHDRALAALSRRRASRRASILNART
jgi:putative membrane protein